MISSLQLKPRLSVPTLPISMKVADETQDASPVTARSTPDQFLGSVTAEPADIDAARLKNLKMRLDGVDMRSIQVGADGRDVNGAASAGARFQQNAFGRVVSSGGTDRLGLGVAESQGGPRSPVPTQLDMLSVGGTALASEDPSSGGSKEAGGGHEHSTWESFKEGAAEFAVGAASVLLGDAGGAAFAMLMSNRTVDGKRNEANGIIGLYRQGGGGTLNENENAQLNQIRDPVPDGMDQGGTPHVTGGMIDAIGKMRRAKGDPVPDDETSSSGGGPVNTGVNGTGRTGSQSQPSPVSDAVTRRVVTGRDLAALRVRLEQNVTHVH